MKSYKAVVIDGKKIIRRILEGGILAVVIMAASFSLKTEQTSPLPRGEALSRQWIAEIMPQISASKNSSFTTAELKASARRLLSFILTFDPYDPTSLPLAELPFLKGLSNSPLAQEANHNLLAVFNPTDADQGKGEAEPSTIGQGQYPITAVDSSQSKALGNSGNKILIRNDTDFGVNVEELLNSPLNINTSGSEPKILILHTHTTECYSPEGASTYQADKSDRSLDETQNMTAVGAAVKAVFDKYNIPAIHDATVHDHPSFNGSYANSLNTVNSYLAKYPSISVVLDLHRDAFVYEDGSKAKFVTKINGKDAAQLMIVVGTNGGGLDHPSWRENMKLAVQLQNKITQKHPSLMRGINLRKERFNGHTTKGSMIIEVGSSGNTLSEAIYGATLGAEEIARFFKGW